MAAKEFRPEVKIDKWGDGDDDVFSIDSDGYERVRQKNGSTIRREAGEESLKYKTRQESLDDILGANSPDGNIAKIKKGYRNREKDYYDGYDENDAWDDIDGHDNKGIMEGGYEEGDDEDND